MNKKEFNSLTFPQQRVFIAKDVLERLDCGMAIERRGKYVHTVIKLTKWTKRNWDRPAKNVWKTQKCEVCAKGALVYAWICNFNSYSVGYAEGTSMIKELGFFPLEMRAAMEKDFEGWSSYGLVTKKSLRWIMNNIIKNKGKYISRGVTYED